MGDGLTIQKSTVWSTIAIASLVWVLAAGQGSIKRTVLLAAAGLGSFAVGCIIGFLFSSYGEEANSIGKVRDWLIGGITGVTLVKIQGGSLRAILITFCVEQTAMEYGLVLSVVVLYVTVGFFFMYLQRELFVNVLLAQKRAERGRVDGSVQTGVVIGSISAKLPPSLLTGAQDADKILDSEETRKLHALLYDCDEVKQFLTSVEQAETQGTPLEYDVVSKAAFVYYYRAYFEKDGDKAEAVHKALAWTLRALQMNPTHPDLTMKYADMLFMDGQYASAVAVLEPLAQRPESPAVASQWLGHYLLLIPSRLQDAVKYLKRYLEYFPDDADGIANLACAYARLYACELKQHGVAQELDSENRKLALAHLAHAVALDSSYREIGRKELVAHGNSFEEMANDAEFQALVAEPKVVAIAAAAAKTSSGESQ